jgi:hypothetical protein
MKPNLATMSVITGMFLTGMPVAAHHSLEGSYVMNQRVTVEGDLVQFLYRNPHSFVTIKGKNPTTGDLVMWSVEWNGAKRLGREGVTPNTLKLGDHVVAVGQPSRNPEHHRLYMETITRPSDKWEWHRAHRFD